MIIIVSGTVGLGGVFALILFFLICQQGGNSLADKILSFVNTNKFTIWIIVLILALFATVAIWRFFKKPIKALLSGLNIAHIGLCTINYLSNIGNSTGFGVFFSLIVGIMFYLADIIITGLIIGFDICVEKYPVSLIFGTALGWLFAYTFW